MRHHTGPFARTAVLIVMAMTLVGIGAGATYIVMKRSVTVTDTEQVRTPGVGVEDPARPSNEPLPDIVFMLSQEAIDRAGIAVARVGQSSDAARTRVPAVVEPNAYRTVEVTPVVAGRVTNVSAELGQQVRRGQPLAHLYSSELADVQRQYLAARAQLDAHERELRRTEKLAEIGSASRQELENIHAEHTTSQTLTQSLRSRLTLLGMTAAQVEKLSSASTVSATVAVPAPIDGVITARQANVGLNVDPATHLFTVVDLSTVWLVGDLYERDFSRVRVGSPVIITMPAYPELLMEGKISYIDPELKPETRTARVRVEVPNPGRQLRIGMYAQMTVDRRELTAERRQAAVDGRVVVPRAAIQMIGNRSVVYLADPSQAGRFIEREVQLGAAVGEDVEVTRGLQAGDSVVIKGSFSLRAERDRVGLRPAANARPSSAVAETRVAVSENGFEPARITARAGAPVRITFVRTTDATCATEVSIPSHNIKRALPLNQPVTIDITPQKSGEIAFTCGIEMLHGVIVIE